MIAFFKMKLYFKRFIICGQSSILSRKRLALYCSAEAITRFFFEQVFLQKLQRSQTLSSKQFFLIQKFSGKDDVMQKVVSSKINQKFHAHHLQVCLLIKVN